MHSFVFLSCLTFLPSFLFLSLCHPPPFFFLPFPFLFAFRSQRWNRVWFWFGFGCVALRCAGLGWHSMTGVGWDRLSDLRRYLLYVCTYSDFDLCTLISSLLVYHIPPLTDPPIRALWALFLPLHLPPPISSARIDICIPQAALYWQLYRRSRPGRCIHPSIQTKIIRDFE